MNIIFTSIGSYPWQKKEDLKKIGLVMKFYDPKETSFPSYFHVIDEQLLFLAAIKYGITFEELTDFDMQRMLNQFKLELEKRNRLFRGI